MTRKQAIQQDKDWMRSLQAPVSMVLINEKVESDSSKVVRCSMVVATDDLGWS